MEKFWEKNQVEIGWVWAGILNWLKKFWCKNILRTIGRQFRRRIFFFSPMTTSRADEIVLKSKFFLGACKPFYRNFRDKNQKLESMESISQEFWGFFEDSVVTFLPQLSLKNKNPRKFKKSSKNSHRVASKWERRYVYF